VESEAPSGTVLAATKVQVPRARSGLVTRARLVASLTAAREAKVALVSAPVGSGKTTLLGEWRAAPDEERPFAWLSLDAGDNDPVRFFEGVIAALRTVEPGIGADALTALAGPAELTDVAVPSLINELTVLPRSVVLVLDDYHLIENERIHAALAYLIEHLPDTLQLTLSTRSEPQLPLGRLRVRGELHEVRAEELRFTDDEAAALLNDVGGLGLADDDIARLQDRTEGWAAGLRLAALSLSGRDDPTAFISSFVGDDRPIVDYLGFEVLDGQSEDVRAFLLRSSILERLYGPLCDAVTGAEGSAARLEQLERANLFLVPLDTGRGWYRYHNLFRGLLRHELARTEPQLLPQLHRSASGWYRENGDVPEAIVHAIAAGDVAEASDLITRHWYEYLQHGRIDTVAAWLDALGDEAVESDSALCLTKAWIAINTGRLSEIGPWVLAARRAIAADDDPPAVLESGVAAVLEIRHYMEGDVERAAEAGRISVERGSSPWRPVGCPVFGIALFWGGHSDEAEVELVRSLDEARTGGNNLSAIHASAALATIRAERGDLIAAGDTAHRALDLADECGLASHWATAMAHVARGRALERRGLLEEAAESIERAVELSQRGVAAVEIAYSRLAEAETLQLQGDGDGAREAAREARRRVEACPEPGILTEMLARTERRLHLAPALGRGVPRRADLTERELALLRLLPGDLNQREIAASLYISVNTVKTHTRGIYRKLGVVSRDDAVARARELGLI
jgi:LuxR family maltose regulon positive regulatory protein